MKVLHTADWHIGQFNSICREVCLYDARGGV